ncbi:hypothetical protein [Streptomyces sp. SID11385]|uniref:hypothetical protein n=1 Tax=Streptomyces sp. SID11385 TaxID=2706031 RepID=UPI0013C5AF48|nr:hypothetical protein [Streptomyces sp. SID11385]NEA39826.1 hypothetical protein [Streptomyces sp. SID11385]
MPFARLNVLPSLWRWCMALRGYLIFLGLALAAVVGSAAVLPAVASHTWPVSADVTPGKPSGRAAAALMVGPEDAGRTRPVRTPDNTPERKTA